MVDSTARLIDGTLRGCQAGKRRSRNVFRQNCRRASGRVRLVLGGRGCTERGRVAKRPRKRATDDARRFGEDTGGEVPTLISVGTLAQSGLPSSVGTPDF